LEDLFGEEHDTWENIQVSSRTDRGVHALKNTFHVDINCATAESNYSSFHHDHHHDHPHASVLQKLRRGINFHLARQRGNWEQDGKRVGQLKRKRQRRSKQQQQPSFTFLGKDSWTRHSANSEVRVLSAAKAPEFMPNKYATTHDPEQPLFVDWNARFSATERTYIYRILCFPCHDRHWEEQDNDDEYSIPFEWDRSWRIRGTEGGLNILAMQAAAKHMQGEKDFSTFRGAKCQRFTPVVTMRSVHIHAEPYGPPFFGGQGQMGVGGKGGLFGFGVGDPAKGPSLVTISIVGSSFLYRQVRNMVGCLVEVGRGKIHAEDIPVILEAKDRSAAPNMAPAHGLFLADVQHGSFHL
jgi:tRNA pseudouridine38-40 synthase